MKYKKITLQVALPDDISESEVDFAIADALKNVDGQVLNSEEYVDLKESEINL